MRAIHVSTTGGPEVLEYTEVPTPEPGDDDALVRVEAAGVNFIDIYYRPGLYKLATPFTPGSEAAGTVEAVGSNVTSVKLGDRVAYAMTLGQSSGPVAPVDPSRLARRGIYLTRPSLAHDTARRDELLWRGREVFDAIASGAVRLRLDRELPLRDAAEAHRWLEGRHTTGKVLLIP
jgi:NADPH:quinone reductase-like Zn-dependent oxidoreductase